MALFPIIMKRRLATQGRPFERTGNRKASSAKPKTPTTIRTLLILADAEFDRLGGRAQEALNPVHEYFSSSIGYQADGSGKITHAEPMLSMGKAKTPQDVFKWLDKLAMPPSTRSGPFSPRSTAFPPPATTPGERLQYVATRGDGTIGQDVTSISEYINDIPLTISETEHDVEVRGELYLPKDTAYDTAGRPFEKQLRRAYQSERKIVRT